MEKISPLKEKLRIVIFCGGYGTRMWPMSRQNFPKQFQPLIGGKSFFQEAVEKVRIGFSPEDIFVSVSANQAKFVREQFPDLPPKNIIAEPERRDTLGAVGYATIFMDHYFPNSLMAVIWGADHLVREKKKFNRLIKIAASVCQQKEVICKIDVKPTYPSTANGWVKVGKPLYRVEGFTVYEFEKFIEKPELKLAKKMFANPSYFINTGYFVWRTSVLLGLYKKYAPECFSHLLKIKKIIGERNKKDEIKKEYSLIEKISVDFGLFEKLKKGNFLVIPGDLGWYDVGTWGLLYEALAIGQKQNISKGDVEYLDANGNLVYVPKGKIAGVVGVENLVIVDTPDGLLVCRRDKSDEVKKLVNLLKKKGKDRYL